jgi:hypothetical protein
MDKITDIDQSSGIKSFEKPKRLRIAYSINNYQPVKSTYIAEEPLFYIDEDMPIDDDGLFDDETYDMIEKELKELGRDLSSLSGEKQPSGREERLLEFMADGSFLNEPSFDLNRQEIKDRLLETLDLSRMTRTLLGFVEKNNINLEITDQVSNVSYDKEAKTIFIRDDLDFNTQVLLTIETLRIVWQDLKKVRKHPLTFHPDHAVLVQRAQAADLKVFLVRCVWELKLAGQDQFWQMLEESPMRDLARTFGREALNDFRSLDNGKAACAVFESWFLSERANYEDKILIQAMLAENNNFIFDNGDTSYQKLTKLIMALGEQPYGKNYLARFTDLIINDPLFTDVRDRSNANFLWFVKFERAYNEAEQDLQNGVVTTLPGIEPTQRHKDTIDDQQEQTFRENIFAEQNTANNVIAVDFGGITNTKEERLF